MKEFIGHYKLVGELGRGGMGVVYKGFDQGLNRDVAIKVLSESLARDEAVVERFKREAKSMAALNDPHIIQIYFIGEDDGAPYFVMEHVDGESLSQRLKREGRLSVAEARRILTQTARGLATAHARGVIHRDVKPGNLMLAPGGTVKIADFGIAMVQDFSKRLTNTGEFVGTPGYLSPEVCVGQPVDHRSDIFALGIVFYEMLTGDIPFTEASPLGMMLEVVKAEIPDVRSVNRDVDDRTCAILKNMIAKDPAQRYQGCGDLLADLAGDGPVTDVSRPASNEFHSAATTALSQLEALPAEDLRGKPTVVSTPSHPRAPEPPRRRSALPLGIAALLVIGAAGATGYLFRDRLFGTGEESVKLVQSADPAPAASGEAAGDARSDRPTETWSPGEVLSSFGLGESKSAGAGDPTGQSAAGDPMPAGVDGGIAALTSPDSPDPAAVADDLAELTAAVDALGKLEALDQAAAASEEVAASVSVAIEQTEAGLKQAQSALEDAGLVARSSDRGATQVATARPLPKPAGPARVVVVAVGDRAIGDPVERLLEEALIDADYELMDEALFPGLNRYAGTDHVDLPGLSELVQAQGGDILVLAQVDYLGETPLEYYGQYSTLYSVNVKVRNILLSERRTIGHGWQQKVDFTTLNATDKAREAIYPYLREFTASLDQFKTRG